MANEEHLAILKQGVETWNKWYDKVLHEAEPRLQQASGNDELYASILKEIEPDLSNANLSEAHLSEAFLVDVKLSGADLHKARLVHANLNGANLRDANLSEAELGICHFFRSDLSGANLSGTDLVFALFQETILTEADFTNARVAWTMFDNVDLSSVKGLETLKHDTSSPVTISTILRSKGNIPETFLRGCGIPERFITFMRSLTSKAIEFYSCFISHSIKDKPFCERLYADLQARGVRVWYFPEDAKWGESVWGEIDRSIKIYDKLIVVCSENSLQSIPVQREIERALNREDKEGKNILFPVRIDDYIFDNWGHERKVDMLRKVVGDFSEWETNATKYESAFEKLLKGLSGATTSVE